MKIEPFELEKNEIKKGFPFKYFITISSLIVLLMVTAIVVGVYTIPSKKITQTTQTANASKTIHSITTSTSLKQNFSTRTSFLYSVSSEVTSSINTSPSTSIILPSTSSILPFTSTVLPITSTVLPITSTVLPIASTVLPITSTVLPSTSSILPITSTILPSTSSTLPITSTELPSTSTVLPSTSTITKILSTYKGNDFILENSFRK